MNCKSCNKELINKHKGAKYCNRKCMALGYSINLETDFIKNINKTDTCWLWTGNLATTGYGRIKKLYAHRISYEMFNGKIPDGMFVCHKCDNPPCVNPDHLFLGTQLDNIRDMHKKGRNNNLSGENTHFSKITGSEAIEIFISDRKYKDIGDEYGITRGCVSAIKSKRTWKKVTDKVSKESKIKDKSSDTWHLSKLKKENVMFIRNNPHIDRRKLAIKFNVTENTIYRVLRNKTWKNI